MTNYKSEWQEIHIQIDAIVRAIPQHFLLDPPDGGDVTVAEGVQRMAARIQQLEAAMQWRPIEEAPKDGTLFLAPSMDGKTVTVGSWSKFYNWWYNWWDDRLVGHLNGHWRPTHFMPLPPPPSGETND